MERNPNKGNNNPIVARMLRTMLLDKLPLSEQQLYQMRQMLMEQKQAGKIKTNIHVEALKTENDVKIENERKQRQIIEAESFELTSRRVSAKKTKLGDKRQANNQIAGQKDLFELPDTLELQKTKQN